MTKEDIQIVTEIVHKTIYQFFDVCGDDEEVPITEKDKLLLAVNKAICNKIKELTPDEHTEAFEAAIKALEQGPCEDAISRRAVLSMQYRIDDSATLSTRDVVNVDDIEDLPSVTPKQKIGHWTKKENEICFTCDQCWTTNASGVKYNFCPNCSAKMAESEEA